MGVNSPENKMAIANPFATTNTSKPAPIQTRSQKHHYVPQFYLKQWCDSDRKLWSYHRIYGGALVESHPSPAGTGHRNDLNSFRKESPFHNIGEPDVIEATIFKEIDQQAALILHALVQKSGYTFNQSQREQWGTFLLSLEARNLRTLERNEAAARAVAAEIAKTHPARATNPERWDHALQYHDMTAMAGNMVRRKMITSIMSPEVSKELRSLQWLTIDFTHDVLITSDQPLIVNLGVKAPRIQTLALALNPRTLFLVLPKETKMTPKFAIDCARGYVSAMLFSDAKYIYMHRSLKTGWYPELHNSIEDYFGKKKEPETTTIGPEQLQREAAAVDFLSEAIVKR